MTDSPPALRKAAALLNLSERSQDGSSQQAPSTSPEGWRLVPVEAGPLENDSDAHIMAFLNGLHAHLPEDERPTAWMHFSDEQRERIRNAYRAMLSSAPEAPAAPPEQWVVDREAIAVELLSEGRFLPDADIEAVIRAIKRAAPQPAHAGGGKR